MLLLCPEGPSMPEIATETTAPAVQAPEPAPPALPGVTLGLATLPDKAMIDEAGLAVALGCCKRSVRKMVSRYELPPAIRFAGRSQWIVGHVQRWILARAEAAARKAERAAEKFGAMGA